MKVGNNPKDWGDFVCPKDKGNVVVDVLKLVGKVLSKHK